jgi:hypothetical protein
MLLPPITAPVTPASAPNAAPRQLPVASPPISPPAALDAGARGGACRISAPKKFRWDRGHKLLSAGIRAVVGADALRLRGERAWRATLNRPAITMSDTPRRSGLRNLFVARVSPVGIVNME